MAVLVKNGKIVNHDRSFKADVLCVDGKIVEIGENIQAPENCQVCESLNIIKKNPKKIVNKFPNKKREIFPM